MQRGIKHPAMLLHTIIALRFHLNDIQAAAVDGG